MALQPELMTHYSIGVDLGGTNLRIAALDDKGQLLEKVTLGVKVFQGRDQVIDAMCEAIAELVEKHKGHAELAGIGVGIPGIIDLKAGTLRACPNLPGWAQFPVQAEIERRLNTRVLLENDANVAALGEKWLGAARHVDDMAMLTLGTGVGGGLVLEKKILHGMTGMAGEFGHMTIDENGVQCKCGNRGCLEAYASATAVARMAKEAIDSGSAPALAEASSSDPEFGAKSIYNLAILGDEAARKIFRRVGSALGIGVANLVNALNLPMYVIGGGVSSAWDAFAPSMFEELRKRSMVYAATAPSEGASSQGASAQVTPSDGAQRTIITRALLGSDAGLFGAARLPFTASQT